MYSKLLPEFGEIALADNFISSLFSSGQTHEVLGLIEDDVEDRFLWIVKWLRLHLWTLISNF